MTNNKETENVSGPQTIQTMSRSIGTAPEFKPGEDWNLYIERLDQFFIANFVEDSRKVIV